MPYRVSFVDLCGILDMPKSQLSREEHGMVIGLHSGGSSNREIADQTGINIRTIQRLVKRFKEEGGTDIPAPKPKPGRPRKVSKKTLRVIKRQLVSQPSLTAKEIKEKNPRLLADVSLRTVQERIHDDLEFKSFRARKKPLLTPTQIKKRRKFCKKYLNWGLDDWKKVLWTDEATFCVSGTGHSRVYRPRGSDANLPQYTIKTVKHPAYLMVWGAFAHGGVGELIFLPSNVRMNQYNYYELLNLHLEDSFDRSASSVLMQDGAPCHTARSVIDWLGDCGVSFINDWPGSSPDFNPIENLWAIIKARLRGRDTSTLAKLQAAIQEVWDSFEPALLQNLVESVPRRLRECLKRKGQVTRY